MCVQTRESRRKLGEKNLSRITCPCEQGFTLDTSISRARWRFGIHKNLHRQSNYQNISRSVPIFFSRSDTVPKFLQVCSDYSDDTPWNNTFMLFVKVNPTWYRLSSRLQPPMKNVAMLGTGPITHDGLSTDESRTHKWRAHNWLRHFEVMLLKYRTLVNSKNLTRLPRRALFLLLNNFTPIFMNPAMLVHVVSQDAILTHTFDPSWIIEDILLGTNKGSRMNYPDAQCDVIPVMSIRNIFEIYCTLILFAYLNPVSIRRRI